MLTYQLVLNRQDGETDSSAEMEETTKDLLQPVVRLLIHRVTLDQTLDPHCMVDRKASADFMAHSELHPTTSL